MPRSKLYLIDANAFCYRAYFALKGLTTSSGQPTNAVYGFVNFLNKILKKDSPQYLGACFDVSHDTFRLRLFSDYKVQRPKMPDELANQLTIIKDILKAYGIAVFQKQGFEADDLIATLAKKAEDHGMDVMVISSDKDILQLANEHISIFSPYKDEGVLYTPKKIQERFGVTPSQIIDFISIAGDSADNIPGAKGLGPKTAVKLIRDFNSVDGISSNLDKIKSEKLRLKIKENLANIDLSRRLAQLKEDVDLDFDLKDLKLKEPDYTSLYRIFRELEFRSLLKDLPVSEDNNKASLDAVNKVNALSEVPRGAKELVLFYSEHLALFDPESKTFFCYEEDEFGADLKNLLCDPKIKKIGHDLQDLKFRLKKHNVLLEGLYFDTMLAAYLLNPARLDYSLSGLVWDYLGLVQKEQAITQELACVLISKLNLVLEKELHQKNLASLFFDLEMPLIDVLVDMKLAGVGLDLEVINDLSSYTETQLVDLNRKIFENAGAQFNINSPKQLREILFVRLKLPVIKKTKSGASTDEEVLEKLTDKHPLPKLLLEYRKLTKIKSTYVDALPLLVDGQSHKIHATFNQAGTQTGRLSCSNPNLQNLPIKTDVGRQIRKAIVAFESDYYLVSADYSQIELRILAHLSKDENLISAFRQDRDIHKTTASLIYGLDEKDITDSMREVAKRINFGIIYGLSAYGLARDLGLRQEEAQAFIDAYFIRYPRVKDYMQAQINKAEKEGFVTTILGRRRYLPDINNKNQSIRQVAQRQAINAPIQGSASDLIKSAMIQIHGQIKQRNLKAQMILQIHDELLFEVKDSDSAKLIDLLKEKMEQIMSLEVSIKANIKKGKNWLEMESVE